MELREYCLFCNWWGFCIRKADTQRESQSEESFHSTSTLPEGREDRGRASHHSERHHVHQWWRAGDSLQELMVPWIVREWKTLLPEWKVRYAEYWEQPGIHGLPRFWSLISLFALCFQILIIHLYFKHHIFFLDLQGGEGKKDCPNIPILLLTRSQITMPIVYVKYHLWLILYLYSLPFLREGYTFLPIDCRSGHLICFDKWMWDQSNVSQFWAEVWVLLFCSFSRLFWLFEIPCISLW